MSTEPMKENKMGIMPVNKLLLSMSVPIMLSMLVQACYNIVDSMFVSRLSEEALTAVSLAFPIQSFMIAMATGTGVGVNALVSRALGAKDREYANKTANNAIYLALFTFLGFFVLIGLLGKPFFSVQTDNPVILNYGVSYIRTVGMISIGLFTQICMEKLLQSTGKTMLSMITQMVGAITNIILDPIMIFGLFGFPRLEVTGAALATITGQILGALLAVYFNLKYNSEITINIKKYRLSGPIVASIYKIGVPSIIMQSIGSIMTFSMNTILMSFTSTATAVFGVYFKLQSFIFMPIFGLNSGLVPIVAFNLGAKRPDRMMKTVRLSIFYAEAIMLFGLLLFQVFPANLLGIFNASESMVEIGTVALRVISVHFLMAGFCIVASSMFQALGYGVLSMICSMLRQLVVLIPSAYILAKVGGLSAVWWSFPIAEIVSMLASILFFRYVYKKEVLPLKKLHA